MKKRLLYTLILVVILLSGCSRRDMEYDIIATTLPVYDFTSALCEGTELSVGQLVTESVSCLHDYTLQVSQMRMIEEAEVVVISGVGLEDFLEDALFSSQVLIDASTNTHVHSSAEQHDSHHQHGHTHSHDLDPHIWLSTENAAIMAETICNKLSALYPHNKDIFLENLSALQQELEQLYNYGHTQLSSLTCRDLITFHDGFAYFAECFDLNILEAIEEESGSEPSAAEIIHLVNLVYEHQIPAVFTEVNGSDACAGILSAETDTAVYALDMAMSGSSYFDAMYYNIDIIKEALT